MRRFDIADVVKIPGLPKAYVDVAAIMIAIATLQIAASLLNLTIPLALHQKGAGAIEAGMVLAGYTLGFAIGAMRAPKFLNRVGHIRTFAGFAALGAVATLMLDYGTQSLVWTVLRAITGFCAATLFTVGESWISSQTEAHERGRVMGAYQVLNKSAQALGPMIGTATGGVITAVATATAFFCSSLIPVCLTRVKEPPPPSGGALPLKGLWTLAPAAVAGVFTAGMVNSAGYSLAAIYVVDLGGTATWAASMMFAAQMASLTVQWPAARLSDSIDRRLVILALNVLATAAGFGIMALGSETPGVWHIVAFAAWGGTSFSYYALCVAHAADRAQGQDMGRVAGGLLFIWATGAVIGPIVGGAVMHLPMGPRALYGYCGLCSGAYVVFMLSRVLIRRGARVRVDFAPAPPTTPVAAGPQDTDKTNP